MMPAPKKVDYASPNQAIGLSLSQPELHALVGRASTARKCSNLLLSSQRDKIACTRCLNTEEK